MYEWHSIAKAINAKAESAGVNVRARITGNVSRHGDVAGVLLSGSPEGIERAIAYGAAYVAKHFAESGDRPAWKRCKAGKGEAFMVCATREGDSGRAFFY